MGKFILIIVLSVLFGYLGSVVYPTIGIVCSISFIGAIIIYQLSEIKKEVQKGGKQYEKK